MGKRITNKDFSDCLRRSKLARFPAAKRFAARELKTATQDLKTAQDSLERGNAKWAIIQAYYAMFHSARALLYSRGFREKSHYCLIVAVRALFVEQGLLDGGMVEAFGMAKVLRENADYENEFSVESADILVHKAQTFLLRSQNILSEGK